MIYGLEAERKSAFRIPLPTYLKRETKALYGRLKANGRVCVKPPLWVNGLVITVDSSSTEGSAARSPLYSLRGLVQNPREEEAW
ncbi:jg3757 [Pararge aegeria aegeria]|uniref:Jg3757 protein n=1 Tax=Pararge aegeria aegeria TaxID=348720 RepID=A0A8S4QN92_9NEOP|nr:jg3757 [Pararge aegeria aegeria]